MKKLIILLFFAASLNISCREKAILSSDEKKILFLHHSTGNNLFKTGKVEEYIHDYNNVNETNYQIAELSYPNAPYPWDNYPYDYWNLWVNQSCDNNNTNIMCLDEIANNYDVVIWKHCFPGAAIQSDDNNPDINSSKRTIANYKLQYKALLNAMDQYPNTKFIVWTLVPLHRNATSSSQAERAYEFVKWVKNTWLNEDEAIHSNVYVFDFFENAAELSLNPENGNQYCLKYEFERDHEGSDSHPNNLANKTIGPIFSDFIIDVLEKDSISTNSNYTNEQNIKIGQNVHSGNIILSGRVELIKAVNIYNISGQKVQSVIGPIDHINTNKLNNGLYIVRINTLLGKYSSKIVIQ